MSSASARPTPTPRRQAGGACARALRRLRIPQALCLPVIRPRQVLAAATVPACLSRVLRALGRPVREVASLCAWAHQAVLPPRLVQPPLLGRCLEELVNLEPGERPATGDGVARRSEPPTGEQAAGARRATKAAATGRPARPRPWFAALAAAPRPDAGPSPPSLPVQAPLDLLARHAGGYRSLAALASAVKVAPRRPSARPPLAVPRALIRAIPPSAWVSRLGSRLVHRFDRYTHPAVAWTAPDPTTARAPIPPGLHLQAGDRSPLAAGHPGFRPGSAAPPDVDGTWRGLYPPTGDGSPPAARHPDPGSEPGTPPDADAATSGAQAARTGEPQAATWSGRSWVLLTSGPQAPLDLLLRLARKTPPAAAEGASEAPAGGRPNRRRPLLRSQAQRAPSGVSAWDAPFTHAPRQAAPAPETLVPTGAQQGFYPQAGSLPLPAAGQPNFRPVLAPPVVSETPPTLLAPQAVFDAPTPHAAASLQQAGRHDEEEVAREDLDQLAERIKRILDDEARRYGIPV